MEHKVLLPCSPDPATGPYSEPAQSSQYPQTYSCKIHFNTILPPMSWSS
jgi:hypothetical protein